MSDVITTAYDTAAAVGGPGAAAAYQLGKELGAKPPGTTVGKHGSASPEYYAERREGIDLLAALDAAGLTRRATISPREDAPAGTRPVTVVLRPDVAGWLRPEVLMFTGGWLAGRVGKIDAAGLARAATFLGGENTPAAPVEGVLPPPTALLLLFHHAVQRQAATSGPADNRPGGVLGGLRQVEVPVVPVLLGAGAVAGVSVVAARPILLRRAGAALLAAARGAARLVRR